MNHTLEVGERRSLASHYTLTTKQDRQGWLSAYIGPSEEKTKKNNSCQTYIHIIMCNQSITRGCLFRQSFLALTTMRLRRPIMHAHTKFKKNRRIEELNMSNSGTVHDLEFDRKWIFTIPRHDGSIKNIQNLSCFSIM